MDAVQTAIKDKIIVVQGRQVILDSDVAALYGVETKRVNRSDQEQPRQIPGRVHSPAYPVRMGRFAVENFDHKIRKGPLCPQSLYRKGTLYAGEQS